MKSWEEFKEAAQTAFNAGDLKQADELWIMAIHVARALPQPDPRLTYSLDSRARLLSSLQRHSEAIPLLKESLQVKMNALGYHQIVGESLNELASTYYKTGDLHNALDTARSCLVCFEQVYGRESEQVGTTCLNMAYVCHVAKMHEQSEQFYKRALAVRTKLFGENHKDTTKVMQDYAKLLRQLNRADEANILDAQATGVITGTWKAIEIPHDQALTSADDLCNFCGTKVAGRTKCPRCGTVVGAPII